MEPTPNNTPRSTQKKTSEGPSDNIRLDPSANRQLTAHAKKLKVSKSKYASAAIAYFAETGLDPTKERLHGLANVSSKVAEETLAVRHQNVEIGNRLIAILRGWEKTLYGFLQQQQAGTLNYLQQIESNILAHQVQSESTYLSPMVEQMFRVNLEANTTRNLAARLFVEATQKPDTVKKPAERFQDQRAALDRERDEMLTTQLREFIKTDSVSKPTLSAKPQVPAIPAKAPSTPAAGTPAPGAAPK